jgi:hypothetical protein
MVYHGEREGYGLPFQIKRGKIYRKKVHEPIGKSYGIFLMSRMKAEEIPGGYVVVYAVDGIAGLALDDIGYFVGRGN